MIVQVLKKTVACLFIFFILFSVMAIPISVKARITADSDYLFTLRAAGYNRDEIDEILATPDGLKRVRSRWLLGMSGFSREEAHLLIPRRVIEEEKEMKITTISLSPLVFLISKDRPDKMPLKPSKPAPDRIHKPVQAKKASPSPMPAPPKSLMKRVLKPYRDIILRASARYKLPVNIVEAVIITESGGDPKALSSKGASGLMQLMPATAGELGVTHIFDPAQNIDGGCRYLSRMRDRFGTDWELPLAAYNAGPTRVAALEAVPEIPETQFYVKRVLTLAKSFEKTTRNPEHPKSEKM